MYGVFVNAANEISIAKQYATFAVTVRWAEGDRHSIRYIKVHPYETTVGPQFTTKKALREYAAKHGIVISHWC